MTVHVEIANRSGKPAPRAELLRAARAAARVSGRSYRLSVAVVSDAEMRRLHKMFSNDPSTTDVLAWPMEESTVHSPRSTVIEGEIAICADVARREARRRGHPFRAELSLYLVHGMLHLAGYDDHAPRKKARMWAAQARIMETAGLALTG